MAASRRVSFPVSEMCIRDSVSSHGKYRLTLKTFELGAFAVHATEISQVLRQYMQEVFAVCNETMHCGCLLYTSRCV